MGKNLFRKNFTPFLILLVVAASFIGLERLSLIDSLKGGLQNVTVPVQLSLQRSFGSISSSFAVFSNVKSMRDKTASLEQENALLKAENAKLKRLQEENSLLRKQLKVGQQKEKVIPSVTVTELAKRLEKAYKEEISELAQAKATKETSSNGTDILIDSIYEQEKVNDIILRILAGFKLADDREYIRMLVRNFEKRGADAVILGCTELPLLISQLDCDVEILDSLQILSEAIIKMTVGGINEPI